MYLSFSFFKLTQYHGLGMNKASTAKVSILKQVSKSLHGFI